MFAATMLPKSGRESKVIEHRWFIGCHRIACKDLKWDFDQFSGDMSGRRRKCERIAARAFFSLRAGRKLSRKKPQKPGSVSSLATIGIRTESGGSRLDFCWKQEAKRISFIIG